MGITQLVINFFSKLAPLYSVYTELSTCIYIKNSILMKISQWSLFLEQVTLVMKHYSTKPSTQPHYTINVVKFNKPRNQLMLVFKMGNSTIDYSTQYEYLGLSLSENGFYKQAITTLVIQLSWQGHFHVNLMCGASKLSFSKSTPLCHLFYSLVRPVTHFNGQLH